MRRHREIRLRKIGRDARTGRFIAVARAKRRPATTTVETLKFRRRCPR